MTGSTADLSDWGTGTDADTDSRKWACPHCPAVVDAERQSAHLEKYCSGVDREIHR